MTLLRKILNFYIQSSIHVGIAVFCLVQLSVSQWSSYSLLVLFGTIVGYNFLKYFEWFVSGKYLQSKFVGVIILTVLAALAFGWFFFEQEVTIQMHLLIALGFVFLYPFTRKIGWLKPFYVSVVVSFVTVYIPLKGSSDAGWIFLHRFFLLASVMIPFEIVDSTTDSVSLKTLPQWFGIVRTKQIGYVLVVLFCIFSNYTPYNFYFSTVIGVSSVAAIYFSSEKKSWYYTSFWVESLPIVWWLLLMVLQ
jgi:hypothetical protein